MVECPVCGETDELAAGRRSRAFRGDQVRDSNVCLGCGVQFWVPQEET